MKNNKLSLVLIGLLCVGSLQNGNAQSCKVEFVTAREVSSGFMLEWKFPEDVTAKQFILERSVDGSVFKRLEIFTDFEASLVVDPTFSFYDSQLGLLKAKYRIKFIGEDQSTFLSQEVSLEKKIMNTYRIIGQELMMQGVLKVSIECLDERNLEFVLVNEVGEEIMKEPWPVKLGLNDFFINLDYFNDGAYSAFIRKNKEYHTITFNKKTKRNNQVALKTKRKTN